MNKKKEELLNKLKQLEEDFNTQVVNIKKQIENVIISFINLLNLVKNIMQF